VLPARDRPPKTPGRIFSFIANLGVATDGAFTLTVNNLATSLDRQHQEVALIDRAAPCED
jgi:hypothetical protein